MKPWALHHSIGKEKKKNEDWKEPFLFLAFFLENGKKKQKRKRIIEGTIEKGIGFEKQKKECADGDSLQIGKVPFLFSVQIGKKVHQKNSSDGIFPSGEKEKKKKKGEFEIEEFLFLFFLQKELNGREEK